MALARADEGTARSSGRLFADFIAEHEVRHFALEESVLLPALPPDDRGRLLAERVRADHRYLCDVAERIRRGRMRPSVELVRAVGARLRAHVQMEERELFPYLERSLDPAALGRLGERLGAGESAGDRASDPYRRRQA
jgi:hemerythrin-like domain-containing protein